MVRFGWWIIVVLVLIVTGCAETRTLGIWEGVEPRTNARIRYEFQGNNRVKQALQTPQGTIIGDGTYEMDGDLLTLHTPPIAVTVNGLEIGGEPRPLNGRLSGEMMELIISNTAVKLYQVGASPSVDVVPSATTEKAGAAATGPSPGDIAATAVTTDHSQKP